MTRAASAAPLLLALAACSGSAPPSAPSGRAAGDPGAHAYVVRGVLVAAPAPVAGRTQVQVRHEAIDDFRDASGQVVGMDAMVMPFEVEPALAKGLAAGDEVELRFTMEWKGPTLRVTGIERLPPGTPLRFGPARPPVAPGPPGR